MHFILYKNNLLSGTYKISRSIRKMCWRKNWLPTPVFLGFLCGSAGKESTCNTGDLDLISGLGRFPREGKGYQLQYSGLENSMDCIVNRVAKSRTQLSNFHYGLKIIISDNNNSIAVVQSLSHVWLLATLWTAAREASLSTNLRSLLKLMSIESVMPSNHLVLIPFSSCLQSFPESGSFLMSQLFASDGQSIGASASASVTPMNVQGWFPLGLTGVIFL